MKASSLCSWESSSLSCQQMALSSSSAIFGHSSAQLLRPKLGFMDLVPRPAMIVSSSSLPRFLRMESQSQLRQSISCASSPSENVSQATNSFSSIALARIGEVKRQLASHGLFDVHVRATGDVHIDDHHTNEDIALAIGTASVADILFPV